MADNLGVVDPFNIDFSGEEETPPIDLGMKAPKVVAEAEAWAGKADYALGSESPGKDFIKNSLEAGDEDTLQDRAVDVEAKKYASAMTTTIQKTIRDGGTPDLTWLTSDPKEVFKEELDKRFILDRMYADKVIAHGLTQRDDQDVVADAEKDNPEAADKIMGTGSKMLRRQQYALRKAADTAEEVKRLSGLKIAGLFGLQVIPWYFQATTSGLMGEGGEFFGGDNLRNQQYSYYAANTDQEAAAMLDRALDRMPDTLSKALYLDFIVKGTAYDELMGNLMTIADLGTTVAIGAKIGQVSVNNARLSKATRDLVKEAGRLDSTIEAGMEAAGDLTGAGVNTALKKPAERAAALGRETEFKDLQGELTSAQNPADVALDGGQRALSNTARAKFENWIGRNRDKLAKMLSDETVDIPLAVPRVLEAAKAEALEDFRSAHTGLSHAVLNVASGKATAEDVALSRIAKAADQDVSKLMQKIRAENKEQLWYDYTEATRIYKEAKDTLNLRIFPRGKGLDSGNIGVIKDSRGRVVDNTKFWKEAAARVEKINDEALKKTLQNAIEVVRLIPPKDRKLFAQTLKLSNIAADNARAVPTEAKARIIKDLGNTPVVGIGLGRSGEAAMQRGASLDRIMKAESDLAQAAGLAPTENMVIQIGHAHEANLFGSIDQAKYWADSVYKLDKYTIQQHGTGHYIEVTKPVNFFSETVQRELVEATKGKTPDQVSRYLNYVTSPAHTLDQETHVDRLIAGLGMSKVESGIKDSLDALNKLPSKYSVRKLWTAESRADFTKFISHQRLAPNREDPTIPGRFSRDAAELDKEFFDVIGRLPGTHEREAYWSYVNLSDLEFAMYNLTLYSQKSRRGWQEHSIGSILPDTSLEGVFLRNGIPTLKEDAGALVVNTDGKTFSYIRTHGGGAPINLGGRRGIAVPTKEDSAARLQKLYDEGYKTVQISEYAEEKLRKAAEASGIKLPEGEINFVLTKSLDSNPLPYLQIPYRPGGHHYYTAEHIVSQPKIRRQANFFDSKKTDTKYFGDNNVSGHMASADAQRTARSFERARLMYIDIKRGGKTTIADMDAFVGKNTPYSGKSLRELFDRGISKGGYSLTEPFMVRPKGQTLDKARKLSDLYGKDGRFLRASDSELDMFKGMDLTYALERDLPLKTIVNKGDSTNPIFKFEEAPMLDPLPTLQRTATDVIRGRHLEDLKFKTANRFIAEFGDMLKPTQEELARNPLRYLHEAPFRTDVPPDLRGKMNAAVNFRRSALEFMNIQTEADKDKKFLRSLAMDAVFNRSEGGPVSRRVAKVLDPWATHSNVNLSQKIKNAGFQAFFAFNFSQYFKQAQGVGAVVGSKLLTKDIVRIPNLMTNGTMFQFLNHYGDDAATLAWASRIAEKVTLGTTKADDFIEAWTTMKKTGFDHVGYERADMAAYESANVLKSPFSKLVDLGGAPMRGGERVTRHAAWLGAYDEWRVLNPGKTLDDTALAGILDKASLLMGDMSRASSSSYQHGLLGLMTSLLPYNIKLAETMFRGLAGKSSRITQREASGIMLMNALTYGIPTAAGAVLLGVPATEIARKWALDNGYDPESYIMQQAWYGFIDTFVLKPMLGEHTNFGERYGPGNGKFLWDFIYGGQDMSPARFLAGAYGTYAFDTLMSIEPVMTWLFGSVTGSDRIYQPGYEDFARIASNASVGYNTVDKLIMAFYTGNHLTKNGNELGATTKTEALMRAAFGIDVQRFADLPKVRGVEKDKLALQTKNYPRIQEQLKLSLRNFAEGNEAAGYLHERNMNALIVASGFTVEERLKLFPRLMQGLHRDAEEVTRRFSMKSGDRLKAFYNRVLKPRENNQ